jgi:serpin B
LITRGKKIISNELQALVQGNTHFALQLCNQLQALEGNVFVSPFGLSLVLGMAYAGARGRTEDQMASVLGYYLSRDRLHKVLPELQGYLNELAHMETHLYLSNSIWPQTDYPFLDSYVKSILEVYGLQLSPVDYIRAHDEARILINDWVAMQTHGKIIDLIPPG